MRELANKQLVVEPANVVSLRNVRLHVQHSSQFNGIFLALPLEFTDSTVWPYDMPEGGLTCGDWFMYPELHEALSLLVTGLPRMGKTEACKNHLFKLGLRRSPDNMRMAIFQTIDQTRDVALSSTDVILFDDIDPSDNANIIHSSAGIWKKCCRQHRYANTDAAIGTRRYRLVFLGSSHLT